MAAAWGLYDLGTGVWDLQAVRAAGIPPDWMPPIAAEGWPIGRLTDDVADAWGVSAHAPVSAALGDNQAAVLATVREPVRDIALTVGTGAQASVVVPRGFRMPPGCRCELRPHPGGRRLLVAASPNGGAAWAWLVRATRRWCSNMGGRPPSIREAYRRLDRLGLRSRDELEVDPAIWESDASPGAA